MFRSRGGRTFVDCDKKVTVDGRYRNVMNREVSMRLFLWIVRSIVRLLLEFVWIIEFLMSNYQSLVNGSGSDEKEEFKVGEA